MVNVIFCEANPNSKWLLLDEFWWNCQVAMPHQLGGFNDFLCAPRDEHIFQMGWFNHQAAHVFAKDCCCLVSKTRIPNATTTQTILLAQVVERTCGCILIESLGILWWEVGLKCQGIIVPFRSWFGPSKIEGFHSVFFSQGSELYLQITSDLRSSGLRSLDCCTGLLLSS